MDTLKMRFKLHELEFEIEGQQDTVKEEFRNFNENILTQLLSKINIANISPAVQPEIPTRKKTIELPEPTDVNESSDEDYPTLKDIKIRDLPKSETEWLLIYAFYATGFGKNEFTRAMLAKSYDESDRKTDIRIGNLTKNLNSLVTGLYIKSTNDTSYILLEAGKIKIMEVLEGKTVARNHHKKTVKPKTKGSDEEDKTIVEQDTIKTKTKSPGSQIAFVDLKYSVKEMTALINYFKTCSAKTQNEEVLLALSWFMENKSKEGATLEEIAYLLKIGTSKMPGALSQVLINLKGPKNNFVEKNADGKYSMTSLGLLQVANNLAKGEK